MIREVLQVANHYRFNASALSRRIGIAVCGLMLIVVSTNNAKALQQSNDFRLPTFRTQQSNETRHKFRPDEQPKNIRPTAYTSHAGQTPHGGQPGQQQVQDDVSVLFAKRLGDSKPKRSVSTKTTARVGGHSVVGQSAGGQVRTKQNATLALPSRGNTRNQSKAGQKRRLNFGALGNMGMSLVVVLAAFFALSWLLKKTGGKSRPNGAIPNQVVQILGRAPLNGRQMMQLVRLGDKVLLLAISPTGTESLGEIVDRDEVDAVTEICMAKNPARIRETFRETLLRVRQERRL